MKRVLIENATIATMQPGTSSYGALEKGAIAVAGGLIRWVGLSTETPAEFRQGPVIDAQSRLITPALIDCHTHLVYGGNRAREFELRLNGATYEDIARAGGGILSTVNATRECSEQKLLAAALPRLDALISEGAGTVEIKSGYGLDIETELKMLRVARRLAAERQVRIKTSFLGAHAIPPDYAGQADSYIDEVVMPALTAAFKEGLADAVDGFCESIAFLPDQMARVFEQAKLLGLPVKLHAEQLSNLHGAALAASYGALSADHLEYLDSDGIGEMAKAGTVAVLLPGAFYYLRETKMPPIEDLRKAAVPIAIATDCNPGSSPVSSLLTTMNMACTLFRLTPEEALAGTTREAARALGLDHEIGTIEAGKRAELAVWNVEQPAELSYAVGFNPLHRRIWGDSSWD